MAEIFKVQKKAIAVIESCTNLNQIDGAEKYVRRMFKVYTVEEFKKVTGKSGKNTAIDFRKAMKEDMFKKLLFKKHTLQNKLNING